MQRAAPPSHSEWCGAGHLLLVWLGQEEEGGGCFVGCCNVPHCSPGTTAVPVSCTLGQSAWPNGLCAVHQGGFNVLCPHVPPMTLQHMFLLAGSNSGSKKSIILCIWSKITCMWGLYHHKNKASPSFQSALSYIRLLDFQGREMLWF